MFNHNTYFSSSMDTIFRNNIFLRVFEYSKQMDQVTRQLKTIQLCQEIWMEDNVYVGGEIGISAGGNDDMITDIVGKIFQ